MYEQVKKTKENTSPAGRLESLSIANSITQKKSRNESTIQLIDNRLGSIRQRELIESLNENKPIHQLRFDSGINKRTINLRRNCSNFDSNKPIQLWTQNQTATHALADTMSDKRVADGFWNYTGLKKNFAFDEDADNLYAHSQGNRHAEPGVLISSLGAYPNQDINLVTERYPCSGCQSDITRAENAGNINVHVKWFVPHNPNPQAQNDLRAIYQQWWQI